MPICLEWPRSNDCVDSFIELRSIIVRELRIES